MIAVALSAAALSLSGSPIPAIVFVSVFAGSVFFCLNLARFGVRLPDIVMLLAMILLTSAFLLPAMEQMRRQSLGKRFFPSVVPARDIALVSGSH